jgi:hypothetical protein
MVAARSCCPCATEATRDISVVTRGAAVLDRNGGLVAQLEILRDRDGAEALLGIVTERAPGRRCRALEGTGGYGAGLASPRRRGHREALLVTAPEPLRARLRRGTWLRQAQACTALVTAATDPDEHPPRFERCG